MGHGDQLMATGMARGAKARGKRIAFGDRRRIVWDQHSPEIFRHNPNIAPPGAEGDQDVEWVAYFKGHRLYNRQAGDRWVWNYDFKAQPGEMFFLNVERRNGLRYGRGFVLIEPDVPSWKSVAPNKDWGRARYQAVADRLRREGFRVGQFRHPKAGPPLAGVEQFRTLNFRDGLAILRNAALYVGPEGGMHHGAAAVGTEAVVLFGGFIPPEVTGYAAHANLTGGAEACGSLRPCAHCRAAMERITVEEVAAAAIERLGVSVG
jgi:ADP-heptose:LPS heptosyltransferase